MHLASSTKQIRTVFRNPSSLENLTKPHRAPCLESQSQKTPSLCNPCSFDSQKHRRIHTMPRPLDSKVEEAKSISSTNVTQRLFALFHFGIFLAAAAPNHLRQHDHAATRLVHSCTLITYPSRSRFALPCPQRTLRHFIIGHQNHAWQGCQCRSGGQHERQPMGTVQDVPRVPCLTSWDPGTSTRAARLGQGSTEEGLEAAEATRPLEKKRREGAVQAFYLHAHALIFLDPLS